MKMLTVALFLALLATFFYYPFWSFLDNLQPFLGVIACFFACGAALLVSLCTFDILVVEKSENVLVFQRKGIFMNETKTFKLAQISEFRLHQSVTYSKIKPVKRYKIQIVLISKKTVDLFKSFDKRQIRESVVSYDLVCSFIRVLRTQMEP